jgi:alcohol dehydrogenase
VLVEVLCCTLCGSDLHTFQGHRTTPCPTILGHEIVGRVADLSKADVARDVDGRPLEVGARVSWSVAVSCGECFFCTRGMPQKCERLLKYGHERLSPEHPLSGGLADYCHLARCTAFVRVPDNVPDEIASTANCATATVAAALRVAGDCRGQTVLVLGAGMLGLTTCAMAREAGAADVMAADINATRLAQAQRFGATTAIDVQRDAQPLREAVSRATNGRGVDLAFEMSGSADATELGIEVLRTGGRAILVGAVYPGRAVQLNGERVVRRLLRIEGIHNYTPADLRTALEFLNRCCTKYPFAELVEGPFSLPDAEQAFRHALSSQAFRVAVRPGRT